MCVSDREDDHDMVHAAHTVTLRQSLIICSLHFQVAEIGWQFWQCPVPCFSSSPSPLVLRGDRNTGSNAEALDGANRVWFLGSSLGEILEWPRIGQQQAVHLWGDDRLR